MDLRKQNLQEGDVIYSNCVGTEICYHIGIVYKKNNNIFIFHNAPTNYNKYGGTVISEKLEDYIKGREFYKIEKTNATNRQILNAAREHKYDSWDSLNFNCEDFVFEIVDGERKSHIRDSWKLAAVGLALISIY